MNWFPLLCALMAMVSLFGIGALMAADSPVWGIAASMVALALFSCVISLFASAVWT